MKVNKAIVKLKDAKLWWSEVVDSEIDPKSIHDKF